jgi:hypothetical protein
LLEKQSEFGTVSKTKIVYVRSSSGRLHENVNFIFFQHKNFLTFIVTVTTLTGNICFTKLRTACMYRIQSEIIFTPC